MFFERSGMIADPFLMFLLSVTVGYAGDMVHGVRLENGSFTGIMGLIERGVSAVGRLSPMSLSSSD